MLRDRYSLNLSNPMKVLLFCSIALMPFAAGCPSPSPSGPEDGSSNGASITVSSPNGGEAWQLGSTEEITWTSSNAGSDVKIDLYKSGSYYKTITSSTLNDGSHSWTIPSSYDESSEYKIRITDTGNSSVYDYSDGYFTITSSPAPTITVTSPNGGEEWLLGSYHEIRWTRSNGGSDVKIELYKSGSYYKTIKGSTSNDGSFWWTIPSTYDQSTEYKVKITDYSDSTVYDYSDSNFRIYTPPPITVLVPNGGETWHLGFAYWIKWGSNNAGPYVKIELYKGTTFYRTIKASTPTDDHEYDWEIPWGYDVGNYKIKITDTSNSSNYDYSDGYFKLIN